MIRTMAVKKNNEVETNLPLEALSGPDIAWYWVDFNQPSDDEAKLLGDFFHFHPLAIEDCMHLLQRPKVDFYNDYSFFVLHGLDQRNISVNEIDLFVNPDFVISFHFEAMKEVDDVWRSEQNHRSAGDPYILTHSILDNLVDNYFPPVYQIEDELDEIENNRNREPMQTMMQQLFETRSDLLNLRHTVLPMRDLLYRILSSQRISEIQLHRAYYTDVYDHLLKLSEIIESNREITADIRDSYLSLNANRMNTVMMTLTVITTIFMPLTFIAGLYGMNFKYMPELNLRYGYFYVLGLMAAIGIIMYLWFKKKGWFER
ncbi:MAG TPA: magnesium/cobalt transporter CorA [Bacillales bacterium]|nr:magnesium/cobalt transporter CorA [Bacillales bacterium]